MARRVASVPRGGTPSVRELLGRAREPDRNRYLVLREAVLSLRRTTERVVAEGAAWVAAFHVGGVEMLRVRLPRKGGKPAGMEVMVTAPGELLAAVAAAAELRPATRQRLEAARRRALRIRGHDDLAEAVTLALLLHARLDRPA